MDRQDQLGAVPKSMLSADEHAKNNLPDVLVGWLAAAFRFHVPRPADLPATRWSVAYCTIVLFEIYCQGKML
jgi:hypothetical protein